MAIYFISDIHLGAKGAKQVTPGNDKEITPKRLKRFTFDSSEQKDIELNSVSGPSKEFYTDLEKVERFKTLVSNLDDAECIYLLGDIFDFWFEYKSVIHSRYFDFLAEMKKLIDRGIVLRLFTGNHDFWGGDFLESIGIEVYKEPRIFEHYGKRIYVGHGDGYARSDWGYNNILKPLLRNPFSILMFRLVHPDLAMFLAKLVSSGSRHYTGSREFPFREEYLWLARDMFAANEIDIFVHGHTHEPKLERIESGIYVDTGNFFRDFSFVRLGHNSIEISALE